MDDLISRQAAIDAMTECYWSIMGDEPPKLDEKTALYVDLKQAVKRLPTAEKKGRWEEKQDNEWAGGGAWVCSECGYGYAFGAYHEAFEFHYCPNCGARMEE